MKNEFVYPQDVFSLGRADLFGNSNPVRREGGLTLRDYFAAQTLASGYADSGDLPMVASLAYKMADAMLIQREKEVKRGK